MSILNNDEIAASKIVTPFIETKVRKSVVSYGLGSFGYDFRISDEFSYISRRTQILAWLKRLVGKRTVLDPKNMDASLYTKTQAAYYDIPAHGFVLARTLEHFDIPEDVTIVCLGKSTYARNGLVLNVTPFEAGWRGYATIEISNTSPLPARIYAFEGIGQALFFQGNPTSQAYHSDGKYQNQGAEVTYAKVER